MANSINGASFPLKRLHHAELRPKYYTRSLVMNDFIAMNNCFSTSKRVKNTDKCRLVCNASTEAAIASDTNLFLGLDFGTSGARAIVIDDDCNVVSDTRSTYPDDGSLDWALTWKRTLFTLISSVPENVRFRLAGISLDGTSSTTLVIDRATLDSVATPILYNESRSEALPFVNSIAPANHTVTSGTSTLCKLVAWWQSQEYPLLTVDRFQMLHQSDWLLALLHGSEPVSDYNNALKVGYDPELESYPDWLKNQSFACMLPPVLPPGMPIGPISKQVSTTYGIPQSCLVCSGTTDSIAAFLAAQPTEKGQAVTSLGSTLAIKLLSSVRVDNAKYGIYSHRLGDSWLVGGASNTGGAVLKKIFSDSELRKLSEKINPQVQSPLDYYPLNALGERFPRADPLLQPKMEPRPDDDVAYLHGLLESMARIEKEGYDLLGELGASPLKEILTAGGGSQNEKWTQIRSRVIGVKVSKSPQTEAAFGTALLARKGALTKKLI